MKFVNKNSKYFIAMIVLIVGVLTAYKIDTTHYLNRFSIDRMLIYIFGIGFIIFNILYDYKKIWDFIYKKRYLLLILIFSFMVLMGYHTSSVGQYDYVIQPNYSANENLPFWGTPRAIRSDEFLAATPAVLSQKLQGSFPTNNNAIMGGISVTLFPQLTTKNLSVLSKPNLIGFLFLNEEMGYSFYALLPIFLALIGTFELFMIITKQKKLLSLLGTVLLVFSPVIMWWSCPEYLYSSTLALVFLNRFINSKTIKQKIIYSLLIGWMGSCFVLLVYPAWQIPYGYLCLLLLIWMIVIDIKKLKWKDLLYLLIVIPIIAMIVIPAILTSQTTMEIMSNTAYPGSRVSSGEVSYYYFYNYFQNIYFSIKTAPNPCESSQFFSLYPIPILLGIWQAIKNFKKKKVDWLSFALAILAILLSIWNYIPIGIFSKISFLYMSTPKRSQIVVGMICIFIMIRHICNASNKKIELKDIVLALLIGSFFTLYGIDQANYYSNGYMDSKMLCFSTILFLVLMVTLILNNKKYNKIFITIMLCLSLFEGATIFPITKGLNAINGKPLSKEIQKIVKDDSSALWMSTNSSLYLSNYALANGARVINSTNFHPNLDLWKKIDDGENDEYVYNRYAHIIFQLTQEETKFDLIQADYFRVFINTNDVCKLNVKYLISDEAIDGYSNKQTKITNIYSEDGKYISTIDCGKEG